MRIASRTKTYAAGVAATLMLILAGCGGSSPPGSASASLAASQAAGKPSSAAASQASTKPSPVSSSAAAQSSAAASKPAQLRKVKLSYSANTAFQSVMWIGKDKGLFEKYGLDADISSIPTQQQIAAMVAGKIDIGITSADNIASAILSGADLKETGLFVPYIEAAFYSRPEIKTAQQLKGKLVGAATAGPGIQRHGDEYALTKLGLDPAKDVDIRVFRTTTDALNAMRSGEIQAMTLFPPDTLAAEKAGFNVLYDMSKDRVLYPSGSTYTTGKFIKEHPDIVLDYTKAISEAIAVFKSDPEAEISAFMKWTDIKDREVAKAGWDWLHEGMPIIPRWSPEPMKATLDFLAADLPKAKTVDPTTLYDNSFIDQLDKAGFYADLQKRYSLTS